MAEYIERDKVLEMSYCTEALTYDNPLIDAKSVVDVQDIEALPVADVEEVKHGTWYHGMENGSVYAKCSACGRKMNYSCYGYARCSLCGAKMDGGRKNDLSR